MKIPDKTERQQTASNYSSGIEVKYFMKLYKNYPKETFSFSVYDTTLSSDNPLRFTKNFL